MTDDRIGSVLSMPCKVLDTLRAWRGAVHESSHLRLESGAMFGQGTGSLTPMRHFPADRVSGMIMRIGPAQHLAMAWPEAGVQGLT